MNTNLNANTDVSSGEQEHEHTHEHECPSAPVDLPGDVETNTGEIARGDRVRISYDSTYSPEPQHRDGIVTSLEGGITIDTLKERRANVPIIVRVIPVTGRLESLTGDDKRTIGQLTHFEKVHEPTTNPEEHMTTYSYKGVVYPKEALQQISVIRDGGYVNMFDRRGVIDVAAQIGFDAAIDALSNAEGAEYISLLEAMNDFDETHGLRSNNGSEGAR